MTEIGVFGEVFFLGLGRIFFGGLILVIESEIVECPPLKHYPEKGSPYFSGDVEQITPKNTRL